MEDVANPTRFIELLRNNEAIDFSGYEGDWHVSIGQWTQHDLDSAARAARSNTSLAMLRVNVAVVADEEEAGRIAFLIESFRYVSHLEITRLDDGDGDCDNDEADDVGDPNTVDQILRGVCRSQSDLAELTLPCSGGRDAIVDFAGRFPGIARLNMVGGPRGGGGLMRVSDAFSHGLAAAIGTWRRHLSHVRHHAAGEPRDVARVMAAIRACPALAEMDVCLDPTHRDVSALTAGVCKVGAANESLRKLHIHVLHNREGDPAGPDRAFFGFPQPLSPNLKALCLHEVRFPAPDSLPLPLRVLGNATLLELHRCDFIDGAASLLYVLDTMPQLQKLILVSPGVPTFSSEGIALFARWIPSHPALNRVAISVGPSWGNDPDASAIEPLLQNCRGALHLTCYEFEAGESGEVGHLHRGLQTAHPQLTSLTLKLCRCRLGDWGLARLFRIVASNPTLQHLSLQLTVRERERGQGVAPALAEMLRTNRTLRRLKLTNVASNLVAEVCAGLVAGLAENRSIQLAGVASRNGGGEGAVPAACLPELVRALRTNVTIRELDGLSLLNPNEHPLAGDAMFLLKQNRFGRSLLRTDPPQAPIGLWARVFANISDAGASDVMYRFLRTKLDLVGHRRRTVAGRVE
jgi:hypothetical protein